LAMIVRRARPTAGQAGWHVVGQAFSSLTNFALAIVVARNVTTAEFDAFSLALAAICSPSTSRERSQFSRWPSATAQ
jgi:hypothetical protein